MLFSSSLVIRIGVPAAILDTYEPFSGRALEGQKGTGRDLSNLISLSKRS
jgi:hypothetical protein